MKINIRKTVGVLKLKEILMKIWLLITSASNSLKPFKTITAPRWKGFLSNKIDTLRQIALKNKQLEAFNKKLKNFN